MLFIKKHFFAFLLFLLGSQACWADIAVIVHPSNNSTPSLAEVRQIFLGKSHSFPNGSKAQPYDLPDNNPNKAIFAEQVLRKSISSLNSYWSRMLFSSKGTPPSIISPEKALQTVANNRAAIAYVDSTQVDASVKVLLTIQ